MLYAADEFAGAFIETFGRNLGLRSVTVSSLTATSVAVLRADPNLHSSIWRRAAARLD